MLSIETSENDIKPNVADPAEIAFELGTWLLGLKAFAGNASEAFADDSRRKSATRERTREFRITHAALLTCAKMNFRLRRSLAGPVSNSTIVSRLGFPIAATDELSSALRDLIILNESFAESSNLAFGEWKSWNAMLEQKLRSSSAAVHLASYAANNGELNLPEKLKKLFEKESVGFSDRSDLDYILPRVGTILRFLDIVGRMLQNDEPLKPALLIFAAIHDQTQPLINYINNRLARFPDEDAALFNSLDGASYSASLELKKVFQQELNGIVGILPAPSVYARIETAYSLLIDSFQQILIDLARSVDPKVSAFDFFPRFQIKLDQSLLLRNHLWQVLKTARAAEQNPETKAVDELKRELNDFLKITIRFLQYKDEETVERFGEEINAARDKKDLVPILHRFGAYLETLFGQINMRSVLAKHPFEETK